MAARKRVKLNGRGIEAILSSTLMHRAVHEAAEATAKNVRSQGIRVGDRDGGSREADLPVEVEMTTTDRAHAFVTITHPAGLAVQSKHGSLTKAAAQAGLDVGGGSLLLDYVTKSGKKRKATQAQIDNWTRGS